tara:strand:- start:4999 stop:7293 length:2295 start_codon:yes stop_codon:yes gene_type:complete
MVSPDQPCPELVKAVSRASAVVASHPQVEQVNAPVIQGNCLQLELLIEVPMPNAWRVGGVSPSGVHRYEPIRLDFPPLFPIDPPEVSLRADFRRDLAHIQPWLTLDKRPVPCIQDGKLPEFMQQHGIAGILNQTVSWLEHAAEGSLINPDQGWEPVRRDVFNEFLVADAYTLRKNVDRSGGFQFNRMGYFRRKEHWFHGQVFNDQYPLNEGSLKSAITGMTGSDQHQRGESLALIVWPGKQPSGDPIVCDVYVPENVDDLRGLKKKAREFGCLKELSDGLNRLAQCVKNYGAAESSPLGIILCARRPFNIIGSTSNIELCCYTLDFNAKEAFPQGEKTPVRPSAHRDQITPELLTRLSGLPPEDSPPAWTLIGAGSLGSKIGLHMGRAGRSPDVIIDSAMMAPHNAARHAMIPYTGDLQILSMEMKARQLREALAGLSQQSHAIIEEVVNVLHTPALSKQAWHRGTWAVINTTASLRVRAALCTQTLQHRVIEVLLYANGHLGVIATEGVNRNPDIGDILTGLYALANVDEEIRLRLYPDGDDKELPRVIVGEGCGSATMQVSDGRISMYAAGMSEYLLSRQQSGLPAQGELLIGRLSDIGMGVNWEHVSVAPVHIITMENESVWTIRLSALAHEKIEREVAHWTDVETGGVLLGRQDEVTRTFYVVDVLSAPEDSRRSRNEFVLGVKGLNRTLKEYVKATSATLYSLGTWHSHLTPSGPSKLDSQTAKAMGLARLAPSVLLIHTKEGYRAVLADRATNDGDSV